MKGYIFVILILFSTVNFAQSKFGSYFERGARICFVGNSITHNGQFYHNVLLYHVTRFPKQPLSIYNCGIGGDYTSAVLARMEDDILVNRPTCAVIMLGMNDVDHSLYRSKATTNPDTLRFRAEAISNYKVNLEKIVNIFLSKKIQVILQKPTIYDETALLPSAIHVGVNDALKACAEQISKVAEKYTLPTVDYYTIMNQINQKMQAKDPKWTIIGPDRIHPSSTGHFVMAYEFLQSEGAPQYVSKIVINRNVANSAKKSLNCEIKSLSESKDERSFNVLENALPYPVMENQQEALELVPFMNRFNLEVLKVNDLKPGNYEISIDGQVIGTFSDQKFKAGINLAEFKNTPQAQQAMKVKDMLEKLWQIEASLRNIKYIEYNEYFKTCPDKSNIAVIKSYLDSVFTIKYTEPSKKRSLGKYVEDKPKQKELEEASEVIRREVYKSADPVVHQFLITKKQ